MARARELFIIMGLLAVLIAALWFWLYLRPANARADQLRYDIAAREERLETARSAAQNRETVYANLSARHAELSEHWARASADLPAVFDDTEVLRHIQSVIYPHTHMIELDFDYSEMREGDLLYSTTVTLTFATSYWQFLSVLYNLVQGDLGNRVVNYTLEVVPLDAAAFDAMRLGVLAGPAFPYIPREFELFGDREVNIQQELMMPATAADPIGLHTLVVEMEVEYLSLLPGLLSETDMRAVWAILDAPPEPEPEPEYYY